MTMLKLMSLLLVVVTLSSASPWIWPGFPYYHGYNYPSYPYYGYHNFHNRPHGQARLIYYGLLEGSCAGAPDGLYYVNEASFAYCSNGQKTLQPCAEGSANPALDHFKTGGYYGYYDFCSINLVAHGYNRPQAYPKPAAYPEPAGYDVTNKDGGHYAVESSYVVEESHGDDYKQEKKPVHAGYEEPKQASGYQEKKYYEKKTYEEPAKAAY